MTINIPESCTWLFNITSLAIVYYVCLCIYKLNRMYAVFPKIVSSLTRISEIFVQRGLSTVHIFISESPIRLTPEGEQLIVDTKFLSFYEKNKKVLLARLKGEKPKTMADLEEACKNIMLPIETTLPGFEPIKQYAYQHAMPIAQVLLACAVKLRDTTAQELNIT